MIRKIIDWVTKQGFKSNLEGIDMEKVIRYTKYVQKNSGRKVGCPEGRMANRAIDMKVRSGIMRRAPGDMP